MWPAFSGVIIVEANKRLHRAIRVGKRQRRLRPALQPALQPPGA